MILEVLPRININFYMKKKGKYQTVSYYFKSKLSGRHFVFLSVKKNRFLLPAFVDSLHD